MWLAARGEVLPCAANLRRRAHRWSSAQPAASRQQHLAARASHIGLYLLMFATTLARLALAGTMRGGALTGCLGMTVPMIFVSQERATHNMLEDSPRSWPICCCAGVVHLVAALRHHFVKCQRRIAAHVDRNKIFVNHSSARRTVP